MVENGSVKQYNHDHTYVRKGSTPGRFRCLCPCSRDHSVNAKQSCPRVSNQQLADATAWNLKTNDEHRHGHHLIGKQLLGRGQHQVVIGALQPTEGAEYECGKSGLKLQRCKCAESHAQFKVTVAVPPAFG